jgi:HK97 family phage portal protein
VAPDGSVYYELRTDNLAGLPDQVTVPASEIIHDSMNCLYHPLCGVSPIFACANAALQGLNIQRNSQQFFQNGSNPGGIITAPGKIADTQAQRIKDYWETNYTGSNVGKVAVLGDGMTYATVAVSAEDSQLIDQLKWSAENVCTAFHVPPYKIGVGTLPQVNNVEALNQEYYSQALQIHIESIELHLDEGLGLAEANQELGTEFDLNDLLRMDTATKARTWGELVKMAIASPNEARFVFNLPPVKGGETPLAQQQNFSLEALAKRDAKDDPFATTPAPAPAGDKPKPEDEDEDEDEGEDAVASERDIALIAHAAHELKLRLMWPGNFQ